MAHARYAYRVTPVATDEHPAEWFETAGEAMRAVDRLRTQRNGLCVIRNAGGATVTEQALAMIVMQDRLRAIQAPLLA